MFTSPRRLRQKKRHGVTSLAGGGDSISNISDEVSHGAFDHFLVSMDGNDMNLGVEEKGTIAMPRLTILKIQYFMRGRNLLIGWNLCKLKKQNKHINKKMKRFTTRN